MRNSALSMLMALSAAGCVSTPPQLHGDFASVDPARASLGEFAGSRVRWAGVVVGERLADSGNCLEVAAFPIDSISLKPYSYGMLPSTGYKALFADGAYLVNRVNSKTPPRFLACSSEGFNLKSYPDFSVVTLVGTIAAPRIFEVARSGCGRAPNPSPIALAHSVPPEPASPQAYYAGNIHSLGDDGCMIRMAVVNARDIVTWDEQSGI